jgi:hypothetical protein
MATPMTVKEFEEAMIKLAKQCECPEWVARAYLGLPEQKDDE